MVVDVARNHDFVGVSHLDEVFKAAVHALWRADHRVFKCVLNASLFKYRPLFADCVRGRLELAGHASTEIKKLTLEGREESRSLGIRFSSEYVHRNHDIRPAAVLGWLVVVSVKV